MALLNDVTMHTMLKACLAKECSVLPFEATVEVRIYLRMSEHSLSLNKAVRVRCHHKLHMCSVNRNPNISNTNFMTIYGCMASSQVLTHLWVFHNQEGLKCTFKKTAYCLGIGWIGTST